LTTALSIQQQLGLLFPPTPEQLEIINAPITEPLLVVAGAGSGKTETMSNRITWLIAHHKIAPSQILGLTFTRKAVVELKHRVRKRLSTYYAKSTPIADELVSFESPEISSYNGFSAGIISEFGYLEGIDSDAKVITDTDRFMIAKDAFHKCFAEDLLKEEGLFTDEMNLDSFLNNFLHFTDDLKNNLLTPEEVQQWVQKTATEFTSKLEDFGTRRHKSYKDKKLAFDPGKPKKDPRAVMEKMIVRQKFLSVAQTFEQLKRERGVIDFADQVSNAVKILEHHEEVGKILRSRYQAVILDEYQDTSPSQIRLLQLIFGQGHHVMAVGDPNQAIYGFRGASSGGIIRFGEDFPTHKESKLEVSKTLTLLTSFRNDELILNAANHVLEINARAKCGSQGEAIQKLTKYQGADIGNLQVKVCGPSGKVVGKSSNSDENHTQVEETLRKLQNLPSEVETVVDFIAEHFKTPGAKGESAAIISATNADLLPFAAELKKRKIPYQMASLKGLLDLPEVVDVLTLAQISFDSGASHLLMRFLTSPKFALGPRDLMKMRQALRLRNRELDAIVKHQQSSEEVPLKPELTLVDLCVEVASQKGTQSNQERWHVAAASIGKKVQLLQQFVGSSPSDYISRAASISGVQEELELLLRVRDLPLDKKEEKLQGASSSYAVQARVNIQELVLRAKQYESTAITPSIGGFFEWLDQARISDAKFEQASFTVDESAVTLITIHGAKGLEWDIVCQVGHTLQQFHKLSWNSKVEDFEKWEEPRSTGWLVSNTSIPDNLRLDRADLKPLVCFDEIESLYDYDCQVVAFEEGVAGRNFAERVRLAYVALTRAKHHLLVTYSPLPRGKKTIYYPTRSFLAALKALGEEEYAKTVRFIREIADLEIEEHIPNEPQSTSWPNLTPTLEQSAYMNVSKAVQAVAARPDTMRNTLLTKSDILQKLMLEKRLQEERRTNWAEYVQLPTVLSTSKMVALASDRNAFLASILRPTPSQPTYYNDIGTRFHFFVQEFFRQKHHLLHANDDYEYVSDMRAGLSIDALVGNFLRSPFSKLEPLSIEQEFMVGSGNHSVIARIDAVFTDPEDASKQLIVDWKTGRHPQGDKLALMSIQLKWYRAAWLSAHPDLDPESVNTAFFFVREGDQGVLERVSLR
jgi:DNA helicase-2/ATP-dependent DNA helicase PcrA